jgi:hypothetical protein
MRAKGSRLNPYRAQVVRSDADGRRGPDDGDQTHPEEAVMNWNPIAIVYMTTFFLLVLGTVVYAVVTLVHGDRGRKGGL